MINRNKKTRLETQFAGIKKIFDEIADAVGNEKLYVIKTIRNNNPLMFPFLTFYLNPLNVLHIGVKSLESNIEPAEEQYESAVDMIQELESISAATNKIIAKVKKSLLSIEDENVRAFAAQYITKTVKIGATAKTVNKAVDSQIIPMFNCMLANKYFDHPSAIIGKTIAVTEKLDGIRALAVIRLTEKNKEFNYQIRIISRQGQLITGLKDVEKAIMQLIVDNKECIEDCVLDGELLVTNRSNIPSKEQYKRTTKIVRTNDETKTGITYNVFDIVDLDSFLGVTTSEQYAERRETLKELFSHYTGSDALHLIPIENTFKANTAYEANEIVIKLVNDARSNDKEGVMLNVCDAPYRCKRTNDLLKVKVFQDCDLKIIGFQEGTGKFSGTLGAIIVGYKGNKLGVGSGITDEQRQEFWNNQDKYLGRVITVQYFEETNNLTGEKSLRFPVFKELREEGKEVSYD